MGIGRPAAFTHRIAAKNPPSKGTKDREGNFCLFLPREISRHWWLKRLFRRYIYFRFHYRSNLSAGITVDPSGTRSLNCQQGVV